jgi:head decoration protein D
MVSTPGAGIADYRDGGEFSPYALLGGEFPRIGRRVPIAAGQTLQPGALLGRTTASGEYRLSAAAAGDGSETPSAVLIESVDTTGGAGDGIVYWTGEFNERALTFGAGHTADSVRDGLRLYSIFLTAVPGLP